MWLRGLEDSLGTGESGMAGSVCMKGPAGWTELWEVREKGDEFRSRGCSGWEAGKGGRDRRAVQEGCMEQR